jgi:AraC-like DNA-binding protein
MSVFAPSLINLWKTIESYGLDPRPLFDHEGVELKLPIDPGLRVPYEKIDRIRAKAFELSGDEAFGLRGAASLLVSQFGALGYAWQASLTLRKACSRLQRFSRIVNDRAVVEVKDHEGCMSVMLDVDAESQCARVRDDYALAAVTRMCQNIMGDGFRLQAVHFKHREPSDLKPFYEFFGCQLRFEQARNELLIPLVLVDEVLPGANPELALLNDQVATKRLAQIDRNDIVTRVRSALMDQLPSGRVSDDSIAGTLHMSVRTMHRKLAETGQSFRGLLVDTRRQLAEQYILDQSLTLTEISLLLGFSESSSFSRAFKNWTGSSPSQARQARQ